MDVIVCTVIWSIFISLQRCLYVICILEESNMYRRCAILLYSTSYTWLWSSRFENLFKVWKSLFLVLLLSDFVMADVSYFLEINLCAIVGWLVNLERMRYDFKKVLWCFRIMLVHLMSMLVGQHLWAYGMSVASITTNAISTLTRLVLNGRRTFI